MKHVELDHTNDTFLICCTDDSRFSLQIHGAVSRFMINDYSSEYTYMENPFVFLIFIVILKLSELDVLSDLKAEELMGNVQPHAETLKEQWDKNIHH